MTREKVIKVIESTFWMKTSIKNYTFFMERCWEVPAE